MCAKIEKHSGVLEEPTILYKVELMLATATIELKVPRRAEQTEQEELQRSMVHHLLAKGQITSAEARELLPADDRVWLLNMLLKEAQENLFLTRQVVDLEWRQRFWNDYDFRLGSLLEWHEEWSTYHNDLLSLLRTVVRRYEPQSLSSEQLELLQSLTQWLHEKQLYREDIFAATRSLSELGLETLMDFGPIARQLVASYDAELNFAK